MTFASGAGRGALGGIIVVLGTVALFWLSVNWMGITSLGGGSPISAFGGLLLFGMALVAASLVALGGTEIPAWRVALAAVAGHLAAFILVFGLIQQVLLDSRAFAMDFLLAALALGCAATMRLAGVGSLVLLSLGVIALWLVAGILRLEDLPAALLLAITLVHPVLTWTVLSAAAVGPMRLQESHMKR
jgi:hypothetical protein